MLKTLASSKALKMACACTCPVVGAGTLTMAVPQVKQAVHKATSPRAYAKPKMRVRPKVTQAAAALNCPPPVVIGVPMMTNGTFAALLPQEDGPIVPVGSLPDVEAPTRLASLTPVRPGPSVGPDFPFFGPRVPPGTPGVPVTPPDAEPPVTPPVSVVPEPAAWTFLILGFGAVGYTLRSRKVRIAGEDVSEVKA